MQKINKKQLSQAIFLAISLLLVVFVAVLNPSIAWFTDSDEINGAGTTPIVDAQLVDVNDVEITSTGSVYQLSLTYTGPSSYNKIIKLTTTGSTVNVVARARVILQWESSLEYVPGITYSSTNTWTNDSGEQFFDYVYLDTVISPNSTVNFITDFNIPALGTEYDNAIADITIQMEVLQATSKAVTDAGWTPPTGWAAI